MSCRKLYFGINTVGGIMITHKEALERFDYIDGELIYRYDLKNQVKKGFKAGAIGSNGYLSVRFNENKLLVHRVIFLHKNGYLPKYIDHIDGNKLNNKIENLREATFSQNRQNTVKYKNNKSGVKGVCWNKQFKSWAASLQTDNKRKFLGYFENLEEAKDAISEHRKLKHCEFTNNG